MKDSYYTNGLKKDFCKQSFLEYSLTQAIILKIYIILLAINEYLQNSIFKTIIY